jgi:PKHD-type hydroxylase
MVRQNWQMWSGGLSGDELNVVLGAVNNIQTTPATTFCNSDETVRSSQVAWISGNNDVKDILWKYVKTANENAFYCDVEKICDIQYTEYHAAKGGHYDWHIDVNWDGDTPRDRKLSVTVQLSDPSEYLGGNFMFGECPSPDLNSRAKGTVLVFPSYLKHRVEPVTKGTRKSLVSWFEGPRWR